MRQLILTGAIILFGLTASLDAVEIHLLPFPTPVADVDPEQVQAEPADEQFVADQEIVVAPEPEKSTYQQQLEAQQESYRERRTRIAQEKGDARRARLAWQKSIGVTPLRPIVNSQVPMSSYSQTWFGGSSYVGPNKWGRNPAYRGWSYGYYYGY